MPGPAPSRVVTRLLVSSLLLVFLAILAPAAAQEVEDCLGCHSDTDLTGTRDGEEFSAFVDESTYGSSVHGDMTCVDCHADLVGDGFHEDEVETVDCGMCHDEPFAEIASGSHGRLRATNVRWAPGCSDCHGKHDIGFVADVEPACAACHARQVREQRRSLHGQASSRL